MSRVVADKVVRDGVQPSGQAVPDATLKPSPGVLGPGVRWRVPEPNAGAPASPAPKTPARGASANPVTGIPNIPVEVTVTPFGAKAGSEAFVRVVPPNAGPPADPTVQQKGSVKPIQEMAPETFIGRTATPHLLNAIEGVRASVREKGPVTATANPTPNSRVTISVPPAFPIDPKEAFDRLDSELVLPPRVQIGDRPVTPVVPDPSFSTEIGVSNSYIESSVAVNLERWDL